MLKLSIISLLLTISSVGFSNNEKDYPSCYYQFNEKTIKKDISNFLNNLEDTSYPTSKLQNEYLSLLNKYSNLDNNVIKKDRVCFIDLLYSLYEEPGNTGFREVWVDWYMNLSMISKKTTNKDLSKILNKKEIFKFKKDMSKDSK